MGLLGVARVLFEHSPDTTAETEDGRTPLHMASMEGHVELGTIPCQARCRCDGPGQGRTNSVGLGDGKGTRGYCLRPSRA
jgi:hypothetical protein